MDYNQAILTHAVFNITSMPNAELSNIKFPNKVVYFDLERVILYITAGWHTIDSASADHLTAMLLPYWESVTDSKSY